MGNFKKWLHEAQQPLIINWNTQVHQNWLDQTSGKTHTFKLQQRALNTLRPHEQPSRARINEAIRLIRSNTSIPMISVGEDGMILDGHGRYYAAVKLLGQTAVVPVEVHILT